MIERKIIINLITSTDYCNRIKGVWKDELLESSTARRIALWVWEYFNKYGSAPGKEIETIYYSKIKDAKFPKDVAEEIEQDILPDLSKEFESTADYNLEFEVSQAEQHFRERHVKLFTDSLQSLLYDNKVEDAEKLVHSFKPLGVISQKIDPFIRSVKEIRELDRKRAKLLLAPWLRAGQLTIIYGNFGTGKSLLSILIAYIMGLRKVDASDIKISEWYQKVSTGCLYVDGEIGEVEMEERIKGYEYLSGESQRQQHPIKILSLPEYQLETEDTFLLSERNNQRKVIDWLTTHPSYKLVILDSASTLFGLLDENSNSEWNIKVNPFLRDLRALGVACILLHHSGKDSKRGLRGASAMGAMAHNIFRLSNIFDKKNWEGEAEFTLEVEKQRSGGKSFSPFSLHFFQANADTMWEIVQRKDKE